MLCYTLFVWLHVNPSTAIRHWRMLPGLPLSECKSVFKSEQYQGQTIFIYYSSLYRLANFQMFPVCFVCFLFLFLFLLVYYWIGMANRWYHVDELNLCIVKFIRCWYWHDDIMASLDHFSLISTAEINQGPSGYYVALETYKLEVDNQDIAQFKSISDRELCHCFFEQYVRTTCRWSKSIINTPVPGC